MNTGINGSVVVFNTCGTCHHFRMVDGGPPCCTLNPPTASMILVPNDQGQMELRKWTFYPSPSAEWPGCSKHQSRRGATNVAAQTVGRSHDLIAKG